ncbi:MAG: hypothetical protein R2830_05160 [Saprospiraceae bacterium]
MHGNSNQNDESHHLYEIWDDQEQEIFEYGISSEPIEDDGLSKRVKEQVQILNLAAGWLRYLARIILKHLPNRILAKEKEDEYMDAFEAQYSRLPRAI